MTTELLDLKRGNYDEFIGTIPDEVKRLGEMVFGFFKQYPGAYNYVLGEGTIYVYLEDDNFQTTGQIVDYLNADFDNPPFKPYRNSDDDSFLGFYDVYLKLDKDILDASGLFGEPAAGETPADGKSPTETRRMHGVRARDYSVQEPSSGDAQPTEEVTREDVQSAFDHPGTFDVGTEELSRDQMAPLHEEAYDTEAYDAGTEEYSEPYVEPVAEAASAEPVGGLADESEYLEKLKVIAKGIEDEAMEVMKRTHASVGAIIPMTFVRIGQKVMIRTNQDQPSFDANYESIRAAAEEIFLDASEITATKNNVQILY